MSHPEVLYTNWDNDAGSRQLYYRFCVISFMRLVRGKRIAFLKEHKLPGQDTTCVDQAIRAVEKDTNWQSEATLIKWNEGLAANQPRRMKNGKAVSFTKAVYAIVACEFALRALRPDISSFWVYDFMRIIPAVYNIDRFDDDIAKAIGQKPNGWAQVRDIAGLDGPALVKDLAKGHCVTAMTAQLNHHPPLHPAPPVSRYQPDLYHPQV